MKHKWVCNAQIIIHQSDDYKISTTMQVFDTLPILVVLVCTSILHQIGQSFSALLCQVLRAFVHSSIYKSVWPPTPLFLWDSHHFPSKEGIRRLTRPILVEARLPYWLEQLIDRHMYLPLRQSCSSWVRSLWATKFCLLTNFFCLCDNWTHFVGKFYFSNFPNACWGQLL